MLYHSPSSPFYGPIIGVYGTVSMIEAALESVHSSICNAVIGRNCLNTRNISEPYVFDTEMFPPHTDLDTHLDTHLVPPEATHAAMSSSPSFLSDNPDSQAVVRSLSSYVYLWPVILTYVLCAILTILFLRQISVSRQLRLSKSITDDHYNSICLTFNRLCPGIDQLLDLNERRKRTIASLEEALSVNGVRDLFSRVERLEEAKAQAAYQFEASRQWILDLFQDKAEQQTQYETLQQRIEDLQGEKGQAVTDLEASGQQLSELRLQFDLENQLCEALEKQVRALREQTHRDESQRQALQKDLSAARDAQRRDHDAHHATQKELDALQDARIQHLLDRAGMERELTSLRNEKKASQEDHQSLIEAYHEASDSRSRAEEELDALQRSSKKDRDYSNRVEKENRDLSYAQQQLKKLYESIQHSYESQKKTVERLRAFNDIETKNIRELGKENEELQQQLKGSDPAAVTRLEQQLDAADREKAEAAEASKATQEQLRRLQSEKATADKELKASQEQASGLESAQKDADKRNSDLQEQTAGLIKQLSEQRQALETAESAKTSADNQRQKQLQELQSQLQEQKVARQKDSKRFEDEYAMLQQQVADYDASIEEARKLSKASSEQSEALLSEKQALQGRNESLAQQLADLQNGQERANEQHAALQREVEDLKARNEAADEIVKQAEDQVTGMASAWEDDKAAQQSLESQVSELHKQAEQAGHEKDQLQHTVAVMDQEMLSLRERLYFLEHPLDLLDDPFFNTLSLDTTLQTGTDGPSQAPQAGVYPQNSATADNNASAAQTSTGETAQNTGDDSVNDLSMVSLEPNAGDFHGSDTHVPATVTQPVLTQAPQNDATETADTFTSAQLLSSGAPFFAQYQAAAFQPSLPAYIAPSNLSFDSMGYSAASSLGPAPTLSSDSFGTWPQPQVSSTDAPLAAPTLTITNSTVAHPSTEATSKPGESEGSSQHQPPETDSLFSALDAVRARRRFAKPVTKNRALRQRQKEWAARKDSQAAQASSSCEASNENAASASTAPTIDAATDEQGVEWEDVPIPSSTQDSEASSAPAPFSTISTGPAFEELDYSELERAFNDAFMPIFTPESLAR